MRQAIRRVLVGTPLLGPFLWRVASLLRIALFSGSRQFWETQYSRGGGSGPGSRGRLAEFKAEVVNSFVREQKVRSVIELGCGDGDQLSLATYPAYVGLDISRTVIGKCRERFRGDGTKRFFPYYPATFLAGRPELMADLALSLDVIFHLVEDRVFETYLKHLFGAAERFVIIYSSDKDERTDSPYVRHRRFSRWVRTHRPDWRLTRRIPNRYPYAGDLSTGSFADFFIYERYERG